MVSALCAFSTTRATDTLFVTMSDLQNDMVECENGECFVAVDNAWHPIHAVYVDDDGFCYLQTGKKSKKHKSFSSSDEDEFACMLRCPDCGRVQTCSLVSQNKGRCSRCREIFPASALSWKCTNCGTQNYLNPEKCGWPPCRCPRHLCDPDVKNNLNSGT